MCGLVGVCCVLLVAAAGVLLAGWVRAWSSVCWWLVMGHRCRVFQGRVIAARGLRWGRVGRPLLRVLVAGRWSCVCA